MPANLRRDRAPDGAPDRAPDRAPDDATTEEVLAHAVNVYGAADSMAIALAGDASAKLPTTPRRAMASLVALAFGAFLFVTNEVTPLGLIEPISADLGVSQSQVGLLVTAFAIVVMLSALPLAMLTTKLRRRDLLAGVTAVWTAGIVVIATSGTFEQLMVGRMITGAAHGLFWAVVPPAAAGMFAPSVRGRSVSRVMLGSAAAGVVGLPVATWLAQEVDWHAPFWILASGGLAVTIAIALIMPGFRTSEGSAARGELPSTRRFIRVLVVLALSVAAMAMTWTYIAPFFVEVTGFSMSSVPLLLTLGGALGVVGMWLAGRSIDRYPVKSVAVAMGLLSLMWLMMATLGSVPAVVLAALVLQGLGWSIAIAALVNWAMRHAPWSSDIAVGAYGGVFNLGNAFGSLLGAGVLAWLGAVWLPAGSLVLALAASVIVWLEKPVRPHLRAR